MSQIDIGHHTSILLDALCREFDDRFEPAYVEAVGHGHFERLAREASVLDFIPVLVYRATKNELLQAGADELHRAA